MAVADRPAPATAGVRPLDMRVLPRVQDAVAGRLTWELSGYLALVAFAFSLRIWDVGARAMHHDESLVATYSWYLFKGLGYQYQPLMHGPFKFFVTALFFLLFGDTETTARLLAVLCGSAIVFLPYFVRREMGRMAAAIAAIALTISPAFLYYSRFARDDIYLSFFALLMAVGLWRFLAGAHDGTGRRNRRWLYVFAAAIGLAITTMEAAYILLFIFGSFLGLWALAEWMVRRRHVRGPSPAGSEAASGDRMADEDPAAGGGLIPALRTVRLDGWMWAAALVVVPVILLYSSFFTNPAGVVDLNHGLLSSNRTDILGGLTYWLSQHGVARGGEPWFYYLLLMPLYEQFALIFGAAGVVWAYFRRDPFVTFLAWWAVLSLAIYSWAGEKMPWLLLHPLLPAILLAACFAGRLLAIASSGWRTVLVAALALLAVAEIHSAQALAYSNAANPTEMLIYVQTSNDVPMVANEMTHLAARIAKRTPAPLIQVDSADVDGWPFEWYFRNLPPADVAYSADFSHSTAPILIMLGPEQAQYGARLQHRYVSSKYIWNWWFPEDYKGLTFDNGLCGSAAAEISSARPRRGRFSCGPESVSGNGHVARPNCSLIQDVPAINVLLSVSPSARPGEACGIGSCSERPSASEAAASSTSMFEGPGAEGFGLERRPARATLRRAVPPRVREVKADGERTVRAEGSRVGAPWTDRRRGRRRP